MKKFYSDLKLKLEKRRNAVIFSLYEKYLKPIMYIEKEPYSKFLYIVFKYENISRVHALSLSKEDAENGAKLFK